MSLLETLGFGANGWGGLLLIAALTTIAVTSAALAIGAVLGSLVAWAKLSNGLLPRIVGDAYTTIFRGVPELLVIYLFYFGASTLVSDFASLLGFAGFVGLPPFLSGEIEAARAVGMGRLLRFRRIIAPQVLRFALPGLGNVWQLSLKDSALVSVTGLAEIMRMSAVAAGSTHQYFLFYVAGAALYLILTAGSNRIFSAAEARVGRSFRHGLGRG
jgi:octopine/nopaline transport system permease protein